MRHKRRVQYDYTGYVYCQNDDCGAEMDATYYPGQPQTWDDPCSDPDVDMPDECPSCGRKTTKRDRDRACEILGEQADERG